MSAGTESWLHEDRATLARDRLLDAAGGAFADHGLTQATMDDIAEGAGCSRGTVYRYFSDRETLRGAYIEREAYRIGAEIGRRTEDIEPFDERLVAALDESLELVAADDVLTTWFTEEAIGATTSLASRSRVIFDMTATFLTGVCAEAADTGRLRKGVDVDAATEFVVRLLLSFLAVPGPFGDGGHGRRSILRGFVVPALFTDTT